MVLFLIFLKVVFWCHNFVGGARKRAGEPPAAGPAVASPTCSALGLQQHSRGRGEACRFSMSAAGSASQRRPSELRMRGRV